MPSFASRLLLAEMGRRGACDVKSPVKVCLQHRVPLLLAHLEQDAVAQDAGVVHHHVNAAEGLERRSHNGLAPLPAGHRIVVGRGLAARLLYLVHHLVRHLYVAPLARLGNARVVHHHLGALLGHKERDLLAYPAARSRYNNPFPFQRAHLTPPSSIETNGLPGGPRL